MKKRCLFCDVMVPTKTEGDFDRYVGCNCSPDGSYSLLRESQAAIYSLPHQKKRDMLHLISAYIRELTDCGGKVELSAEQLESIVNSPDIPIAIEEKGGRLLQYLQRHSGGPGEPVVIHPLSGNFNLTYSPNMQEMVYIMDKLSSERMLIREGTAFKLTEKGWNEATARAGGKKLKPCAILIPDFEALRTEWQDLLPKIEQYGYLPHLISNSQTQNRETVTLELISDSKLILADLTGQSPEVYFLAGYALGLKIPVIWTVSSKEADSLPLKLKEIRPIVRDTMEELAVILQQRLGS